MHIIITPLDYRDKPWTPIHHEIIPHFVQCVSDALDDQDRFLGLGISDWRFRFRGMTAEEMAHVGFPQHPDPWASLRRNIPRRCGD